MPISDKQKAILKRWRGPKPTIKMVGEDGCWQGQIYWKGKNVCAGNALSRHGHALQSAKRWRKVVMVGILLGEYGGP